MRFPTLSAAAFAATVFVSSVLGADEIRVAGSDLLAGALQANLTDFGKANDTPLNFDLRGSRLGLEALQSGKADLGLLVFSNQDPKPGPQFSDAVIGYLTSVVVVPAEVSLTQISYPQLAGVFGVSELNSYKRWSEIGALGAWAPRAISGMALRRSSGLSLDLFRYNVLQKPELKPTIALLETPEEAYTRLLGEEGGIAILPSVPPAGSKLKVLLLAKAAGDVAYPPTAENLHTGDYPLRLPVHIVFRKGEAGKLSRVIRHILADETAPALQSVGVTPLPVQARNQLVFDLETK
jgi:ABC-type phosphate transport system substrate-binding protein